MKMRGIRPDFWTDEKVVEVSAFARLLFVGLWQMACDNGHVEDSPKRIKMSILPADPVDVDGLLAELVGVGLIDRGDGWIVVPHLAKHQRIDRRYFLTCDHSGCCPPPVGKSTDSRTSHDVATPGKARKKGTDTAGARRGHSVRTAGPRDEGEGEGESKRVPSPPAADEDAFDTWWSHYPRKTDKGHARTAFVRALKKTTLEILIAAADRMAETTAPEDRQYWPYPATWLNGERWLDQHTEQPVLGPVYVPSYHGDPDDMSSYAAHQSRCAGLSECICAGAA